MDLGCLMTPGLSKDILCLTILLKTVCAREGREGEGEREKGREGEMGGFGLFNDTWSQ